MKSRKIQQSLKGNFYLVWISLKSTRHLILCQKDTLKGCLLSLQIQPNQLKATYACWCYMESMGADHEDVYMRALCESLGGNADYWLYTLAPGSIIGYDMFTDLLRKEWGESIDESMHPNNDFVVEDQSVKDN